MSNWHRLDHNDMLSRRRAMPLALGRMMAFKRFKSTRLDAQDSWDNVNVAEKPNFSVGSSNYGYRHL